MSRRNENRPGYKGTKVGWIPVDWNYKKFSQIATVVKGQVSPKDAIYENHTHIGPENIESNTGRLSGLQTAKEQGLTSGKYLFDEHSIVYSKIRPNLNKVCMPGFNGICSADAYPILISRGIDSKYIFFFMMSVPFVRQAVSCSMRTGLPKINRGDLNSIGIFIPPPPRTEKNRRNPFRLGPRN